jgi:aldose 1-epimerase
MDEVILAARAAPVATETFGHLGNGQPLPAFVLRNEHMEVRILRLGGRIASLQVPDRHGRFADVVLGFDTLAQYLADRDYFGAIVGRYANRIAGASFEIDGRCFDLVRNDGQHCLHGGEGLDQRLWSASVVDGALMLSYVSPDGEAGFPGRLEVRVRYALAGGTLRIDYEAVTDRSTHVCLSNHAYFNLAGGGDVLGHELTLPAPAYLAVDDGLIPKGLPVPVAGSAFDFRQPQRIGAHLQDDDEQLHKAGGYDHCWVSGSAEDDEIRLVARLREPNSGRIMEILSSEPAIQFYSGNFLDGSLRGRGDVAYARHAGLCLEPQHYPDSPNRADFPSTLLRPGEVLRSTTLYRFYTDRRGATA